MLFRISMAVLGVIIWMISAISGWAGLISIPALMLFGLPPQVAIATSKFSGLWSAIGAIAKFRKEKKILRRISLPMCILAIGWWYLGAHIVIALNDRVLSIVVWILLLVLLPIVLMGNIGVAHTVTSQLKKIIWSIVYFFLSIVGGFFWGLGPLFMANLMYFFGLDIIQANATDFVPYFFLSVTSVIVLIWQWFLDRKLAIILFVGKLLWGYIGAHLAIKKWTRRVKIVFAIVVVASAVKILFF